MMTHDCDILSFGGFFMRSVPRSDRVRTAKIDLTQCQKYAPIIEVAVGFFDLMPKLGSFMDVLLI